MYDYERWDEENTVMMLEAEQDEVFKIRFELEKQGEYEY